MIEFRAIRDDAPALAVDATKHVNARLHSFHPLTQVDAADGAGLIVVVEEVDGGAVAGHVVEHAVPRTVGDEHVDAVGNAPHRMAYGAPRSFMKNES